MKRQTKQTLGAGLLLGSIITAVVLYKRSKQPGLSTNVTRVFGQLTAKDLRRKRVVRQMAAMRGEAPQRTDYSRVEKVLPNGMTRRYALKYRQMLLDRKKPQRMRYYSPENMGLPSDKVVV